MKVLTFVILILSLSLLANEEIKNKVKDETKSIKLEAKVENSKKMEKISKDELLKRIINKFENLYTEESSVALMEMQIKNKYFKRKLIFKAWSRGDDKSLIKVVYPKKDKGISTLKIDKEMYNYFPKINRIMKIPSSMMMGSWMGSDFTNDDLLKDSNYEIDFNSKFLNSKDNNLYIIEFIPKKDKAIVWGKVVITVKSDNLLPLKSEFYDEKLKKVRIINFKEFKKFGTKEIPSVMELMPLSSNKKGHKTIIKFKKLKFDINLKDDFFSLNNLRNKR